MAIIVRPVPLPFFIFLNSLASEEISLPHRCGVEVSHQYSAIHYPSDTFPVGTGSRIRKGSCAGPYRLDLRPGELYAGYEFFEKLIIVRSLLVFYYNI